MSRSSFTTGRSCAAALDRDDELAGFRRRFHIPRDGAKRLSYLCGHSLGLMPKAAAGRVTAELDRWATRAVEAHFDSPNAWYAYHEQFARPLAELTGARESEVVAMNSLTVNLHLMLVSFYRPNRRRHKILIERGAFPSDRYAVESQIRYHGFDPRRSLVEFEPDSPAGSFSNERFAELMRRDGSQIALVLLPGVQFSSGQAFDIAHLSRLARNAGCAIGFDLAHAIGNTRLALHRAGPDFAVWCSYKYLNAGPGAIGGAFVHARHGRGPELPRFAGWWGHDKQRRFAMDRDFRALPGAEAWQLSNPPILAMAPLAASLDVFSAAGFDRLLAKSRRLTAYLDYLLRTKLGERISILTPLSPKQRGAQISMRIEPPCDLGRLERDLRRLGVVADTRQPRILRFSPVPLYNRYADVHAAVTALERALA